MANGKIKQWSMVAVSTVISLNYFSEAPNERIRVAGLNTSKLEPEGKGNSREQNYWDVDSLGIMCSPHIVRHVLAFHYLNYLHDGE